jgi:DNA-binding HxlR family transcriptional regulator
VRHDELATSNCAISRAGAILGNRWVFTILRAAYFEARTFEDYQRMTGIARNVLTDRLRGLEADGILARRAYEETANRTRFQYRLTPAGLELYPLVAALMEWGNKHTGLPDGPPIVLRHERCGEITHPVVVCDHCGEPIDAHEVTALPGPGAREGDLLVRRQRERAAPDGSAAG